MTKELLDYAAFSLHLWHIIPLAVQAKFLGVSLDCLLHLQSITTLLFPTKQVLHPSALAHLWLWPSFSNLGDSHSNQPPSLPPANLSYLKVIFYTTTRRIYLKHKPGYVAWLSTSVAFSCYKMKLLIMAPRPTRVSPSLDWHDFPVKRILFCKYTKLLVISWTHVIVLCLCTFSISI